MQTEAMVVTLLSTAPPFSQKAAQRAYIIPLVARVERQLPVMGVMAAVYSMLAHHTAIAEVPQVVQAGELAGRAQAALMERVRLVAVQVLLLMVPAGAVVVVVKRARMHRAARPVLAVKEQIAVVSWQAPREQRARLERLLEMAVVQVVRAAAAAAVNIT